MTDRARLIELAERCEKADGPDRELDCRAHLARHPTAMLMTDTGGYRNERPVQYTPAIELIDRWNGTWPDFASLIDAPVYTASLDAAMSLVPEGCGVHIHRYWTAKHDGPVWSAELAFGGVPSNPRRVFDCYDAATPALALCAAALRAMAGEGQTPS